MKSCNKYNICNKYNEIMYTCCVVCVALWLIVDAQVHISLLIIKVNTNDEVILILKLFNHFIV